MHTHLSGDEVYKVVEKCVGMPGKERWCVFNKEVHQTQGVSLYPSVEVHHGAGEMCCQNIEVWLNMSTNLNATGKKSKNCYHYRI